MVIGECYSWTKDILSNKEQRTIKQLQRETSVVYQLRKHELFGPSGGKKIIKSAVKSVVGGKIVV